MIPECITAKGTNWLSIQKGPTDCQGKKGPNGCQGRRDQLSGKGGHLAINIKGTNWLCAKGQTGYQSKMCKY